MNSASLFLFSASALLLLCPRGLDAAPFARADDLSPYDLVLPIPGNYFTRYPTATLIDSRPVYESVALVEPENWETAESNVEEPRPPATLYSAPQKRQLVARVGKRSAIRMMAKRQPYQARVG